MQVAFLVQIAYAIFTWLLAGLVIEYQGYNFIASGIKLKSGLIDYYIFFLVFLFGVRNAEDGLKVIKWILVGAIFANLCTILDAAGIVNLGFKERIDGRTQGAMGESNQYAAYIILFIPGMIAAAVGSRGLMRLAWLAGALLSCFALAMTASRGGIVGAVLACVIGAYLFRHLVSYSRVAGWVLGSLAVFVVVTQLLAVRRTAVRTHLRADRRHRRDRGDLRPQRDLGQPVPDHDAGADHLHHRLRLECVLVVSVPLLASQPLLLAVVQPRAGRPHHRLLPAVRRHQPRAPRQPGRRSGVATAAHRLRHRRDRCLWRRVLRRAARSLDLLLDVHRHRHAAGACASQPQRCARRRAGAARAAVALRAMRFGWAAPPGRRSP